MNTIKLHDTIFALYDEGGNHIMPLPPRYENPEPARLIVRMRSTRGGKNAWWRAGDAARACLNNAPYQPLFRGVVESFQWDPPDTSDCPSFVGREWGVAPHEIVQGGSGWAVLNWHGFTVSPLPDPVGDTIRELVSHHPAQAGPLENWGPAGVRAAREQGHANIYVCANNEIRQELYEHIKCSSGNAWFYNHAVINHAGYAYRVVDDTAIAVVIPQNRGCYILSPRPSRADDTTL